MSSVVVITGSTTLLRERSCLALICMQFVLSNKASAPPLLPPPVLRPPYSQELEEQAADLGELYEKKYQLLHKSMKKQQSRKRRRPDDGEGGRRRRERRGRPVADVSSSCRCR